jgi:hypothetical protein
MRDPARQAAPLALRIPWLGATSARCIGANRQRIATSVFRCFRTSGAGTFSRSFDAEILQLLAGLELRGEPARLQPTSRPGFRGVLGVAVFRGNGAPQATAGALRARSVQGKTVQLVEPALHRATFFGDFRIEDGVNLIGPISRTNTATAGSTIATTSCVLRFRKRCYGTQVGVR